MATKGGEERDQTAYYSPMPPHQNPTYQPAPPSDQYYILLPYHPWRRNHHLRHLKSCLICFLSLILFSIALFLLWPSDPKIEVVRIHLNHVRLHTSPVISLDISLALTLKVHNPDFFSLNYTSLVVSIGYRGRKLGFVSSDGGLVKARASSYVDATLNLNGIEVLHDVFYLIKDLAKGSIPFDTVTVVTGHLGVLLFQIPIKGKVSCEVNVNTDNQTIVRQDCYPE